MTACRLLTLQKVQRTISDNCAGRDFMTGVDGTTGEALCSEPQPNFSVRCYWKKCKQRKEKWAAESFMDTPQSH